MSRAPHHQRNQVVAEAAQEQCREQVDHHDHAVHGDELVIILRVNKRECVGEAQLQAHHRRQAQRDQTDKDGRHAVLDGDDLVVLAPDVLGYERLRIVMLDFMVTVCNCNVSHPVPLFELSVYCRHVAADRPVTC